MLKNVTCWPFSDDIKVGLYECLVQTEGEPRIEARANRIIINSNSGSMADLTLKSGRVTADINYCLFAYAEKETPYYPLFACSDDFDDIATLEHNMDSDVKMYPDRTFTRRRYGYKYDDLERLEAFKGL